MARRLSGSTGASGLGVGVASRLFPASFVAPSVTVVSVDQAALAASRTRRSSSAGAEATAVERHNAATASSAAFSRLYAHAVGLMEHKDDVFRQFGLHKNGDVSTTGGGSKKRPPTKALRRTSSTPACTRNAAAATPRKGARRPRIYERSNSAPLSERRAPSGGAARNFSLQSTMASRAAVSPYRRVPVDSLRRIASSKVARSYRGPAAVSKPKPTSTPHIKSTAQQSQKPGPPSAKHNFANQPRSPKGKASPSGFATSARDAQKRRPSERGAQEEAVIATITTTQRVLRRQSSHPAMSTLSKTSDPQTTPGSTLSSRKTSFIGSRPGMTPPPPPVLIEVSRRTSSPILLPTASGDFGMKRRPSVARIPASGCGPFRAEDVQMSSTGFPSTGPRASMIVRRDAKLERLMEQVSVLKASLGLSEEDLQWKVESTRGNAFLAAERRLSECEERYDRLEYEIQLLTQTPCEEVSTHLLKKLRDLLQQSNAIAEAKPRLAACQSDIAQCKKDLINARVQLEVRVAELSGGGDNPIPETEAVDLQLKILEETKSAVLMVQEQLKNDLSRLNGMLVTLSNDTDTLDRACADFKFMSPSASIVSSKLISLLKNIPECSGGGDKLMSLCDQAIRTTQKLKGSRAKDLKEKQQELERTTKDIEVWKTRRDQAKEYGAEMAKRDQEWQEHNHDDNTACLGLLRGLIPCDVHQLTIDGIIERAEQEGGVLFTYDLAVYIKNNKFLHWLVTHESDIARDNFLAIESASFFMNFVSYDITELRAVARVLPISFELDKDTKKAVWKMQFLEHVYMLVKQQNGEKVKAGWDPVKRARAEVQLKPLSDRQLVNPVYRYPTDDEIKVRIDKYELQLNRLRQKREKLKQLEDDLIPAAKTEYLAITEDARSEELQRSFGKAAIIKLREGAKQQHLSLCKTRDTLKSEIRHAENAWKSMSPSYDQYLAEVDKIRRLDPEIRATRVRGPFPSDIDPKPKERAAFKKLSVEEEAQARKMELESAIAQRSQEIADSDSTTIDNQVEVSSQPPPIPESSSKEVGDAEVPIPVAIVEVRQPTLTAEVGVDSPVPKSESDGQSSAPHGFQKVRSLRVAANVLRFLEQDFCSPKRIGATASPHSRVAPSPAPGGDVATPVRRTTPINTGAPPAPESVSDAPERPPLTRPKSKTLLLLLEKEAAAKSEVDAPVPILSPATPHPLAASGGKPNFLGELQSKVNRLKPAGINGTSTASKEAGELVVSPLPLLTPRPVVPDASPPRAGNFLAELKRKAASKLLGNTSDTDAMSRL